MLYIVRLSGNNSNILNFCSPCHDCSCKLKQCGINKIVYINESGELEHGKLSCMEITHVSLGNRVLGKTVEID